MFHLARFQAGMTIYGKWFRVQTSEAYIPETFNASSWSRCFDSASAVTMMNIVTPHASHAMMCAVSTFSALLVTLNFTLLCNFPENVKLRRAFLVLSGLVALTLLPLGLDAFPKSLSVQVCP